MDKGDINYLRDLALSLEGTKSDIAYELMSMALMYRPDGTFIHKKTKEYENRYFKKILTARKDGKGERVNAILNGVLLSNQTKRDFLFSWHTESPALKNELIDLDRQIPDFFDGEFLRRHYISFEGIRFYSLHNSNPPECEIVSGDSHVPTMGGVDGDPINIIPGVKTNNDVDYGVAINRIFKDKYLSLLGTYQSCSRFVGIHYRGGDVIYGDHRHHKHAIREKSAALGMVERLIQDYDNENIILFGTTLGDTLGDLLYLKCKYDNVTLSMNLASDDYDYLMQDCMMMSHCKKLIGMRDTGVIRLAQKFNTNLKVEYFSDIIQDFDLYDLLLSGVNNTVYNALQRSYHAPRALSTSDKDSVYLVGKIKELDPENKFKWYNRQKKISSVKRI